MFKKWMIFIILLILIINTGCIESSTSEPSSAKMETPTQIPTQTPKPMPTPEQGWWNTGSHTKNGSYLGDISPEDNLLGAELKDVVIITFDGGRIRDEKPESLFTVTYGVWPKIRKYNNNYDIILKRTYRTSENSKFQKLSLRYSYYEFESYMYDTYGYPPNLEIFEWWDSDEDGKIDKLAVKYVGPKGSFAYRINNAEAAGDHEEYFRTRSGDTMVQMWCLGYDMLIKYPDLYKENFGDDAYEDSLKLYRDWDIEKILDNH